MMNDGPRRQGRFIKSGSKVLEKVSLVDFSFKEINDAKVIAPDNSKRTIIHSSYHDEAELNSSVVGPEKFNDDLMTRDNMRQVIFPIDFTKDWERDKKLRKDRVARQDDDDFELELEARRREEEEEESQAAAQTSAAPASKESAGQKLAVAESPTPKAAGAPSTPATGSHWKSMDVVGKAIKGLSGFEGIEELAEEAAAQPQPAMAAPTTSASGISKATDAFIPVSSVANAAMSPVDPEAVAAEEYKLRIEALKANEARLAELEEEAKARGYRDGFRMGEEKGEVQTRQNAGALFGKVAELIHEFSGLKHEILNNVQENFYELCQAMAESLIKREFSIHPDAFVTVLRRAIEEAVEPGKFKIRVHPETYERVAGLGSSDILDSLVRDKEIPPSDFKIESQLSVVDVNVSKMITELLQQADLRLFEAAAEEGENADNAQEKKAS